MAAHDDVYAAVRAAFEEHSVLLFRRQPVTDELQVAYSQRFGPLEIAKAASLGEGTPFSHPDQHRPRDRQAGAARSQGSAARPRQPAVAYRQFIQSAAGARVGAVRAGDSAARRRNGIRLDAARVGAAAGNRAQPVASSYAWHDYAHSRGKIAPQLASERERTTMPPVCWRMRWVNPVNGRAALYVASHTCGIEGMPQDEALALVDQLIADSNAARIYLPASVAGGRRRDVGQPRDAAPRPAVARQPASAPHGAHDDLGDGRRRRRGFASRARRGVTAVGTLLLARGRCASSSIPTYGWTGSYSTTPASLRSNTRLSTHKHKSLPTNRACKSWRVPGYRLRREVMTPELQEECVAECRRVVHITAPPFVTNGALPLCRDSDNQKFLELARDCEADYLVSKDRQLLILSARRRPLLPFDVVTPRRLNDVLVSMA